MNKLRRKEIDKIINSLRELSSSIEFIKDEEQDYMDNMPENLMESERYYVAEEAVESLDSAYDLLDDAIDCLEEARG